MLGFGHSHQQKMKQVISSILRHFPPVDFVFAYGSGVFKQEGRELGKMIDLIFVVSDAQEWHTKNLSLNSSHYSFLRYFGSSVITAVQRRPAAVYYNTLINVDSQLVKYGVISKEDFYSDLLDWKWLYTSGRLQKPVVHVNINLDKEELNKALDSNFRSAMVCALLLMEKDSFTIEELFIKLTGLSYMGDFRMIIGEDKNKIVNIVKPTLTQFQAIYSTLVEEYICPDSEQQGQWRLKNSGLTLDECLDHLPRGIRERVSSGQSLRRAVTSIVAPASLVQSLKGVTTAGLLKSIRYSGAKLSKMFRSL